MIFVSLFNFVLFPLFDEKNENCFRKTPKKLEKTEFVLKN